MKNYKIKKMPNLEKSNLKRGIKNGNGTLLKAQIQT